MQIHYKIIKLEIYNKNIKVNNKKEDPNSSLD